MFSRSVECSNRPAFAEGSSEWPHFPFRFSLPCSWSILTGSPVWTRSWWSFCPFRDLSGNLSRKSVWFRWSSYCISGIIFWTIIRANCSILRAYKTEKEFADKIEFSKHYLDQKGLSLEKNLGKFGLYFLTKMLDFQVLGLGLAHLGVFAVYLMSFSFMLIKSQRY